MKKYMTIEEYFKTQTIDKRNTRRRKIIRHLIAILCFIIIILSLYTIFNWYVDNSKIKHIETKIEKNINIKSINLDGELINPPSNINSNYYYYVNFPFIDVDFSSLMAINKETIAFIQVNNTNVNYPVVKTKDNTYYLKHSFDMKKNLAGWIFMDYRNNEDNLDDNTVIYGHSRLDGTLFGSLRNVLSNGWQKNKDNYVINLSTIKDNLLFQIFSIYTINKESYYMMTNFENENEKQEWLDTMKKRNIAPIKTDVDINDKILTLSTCKNSKGERIVVQAKLIKKQEK